MAKKTFSTDNYDPNIIPAETNARLEREGTNFKQLPDSEGDLDTTGGYTVDNEGLLNNYAVEPEMYVNEPGDLREKEEADAAKPAQTLKEVNETNKDGQLSMANDTRGKGPGRL